MKMPSRIGLLRRAMRAICPMIGRVSISKNIQFYLQGVVTIALALMLVTPAKAATFSVLTSKLTEPAGRMAININGGAGFGTFFRDTTVTLADGTYTISLRGGQADFGTFTISNDVITTTTGALVLNATDVLDFDLTALARVEITGSTLTIPAGRNTTTVPEVAGTFFGDGVMYLPPTKTGSTLFVTDRSGRALYGAFIVDAAKQAKLTPGPIDSAEALTLSGNVIGFNHSLLAEININGAALTSPEGLQTLAIPETAGTFFGNGTIFLPPSRDGLASYKITDRGGHGIFGAIDIDCDLSVTDPGGVVSSANALEIEETIPTSGGRAFDVSFNTNKLATFTLENAVLSYPNLGQLLVGINESVGFRGTDLTVNLPPTANSSRPYQVIPRSGGGSNYGSIWVNTDLSISYDGALVPMADGFTYDACALNQLKLIPAPGFSVSIPECTGNLYSEHTLVLPSGNYQARISNSAGSTLIPFLLGAPEDTTLPQTSGVSFELVDCTPPDLDSDGIPNAMDNCPTIPNADQIDLDQDGFGDACDNDLDGDSKLNENDNCVDFTNPDQLDFDLDGIGDACDNDADGDSVTNDVDNCPGLANETQADSDADASGDACDSDDDNDDVLDTLDNCVFAANAGQADADSDGQGDVCDGDDDNDGVGDTDDLCSATPGEVLVNTDGCDGAGLIAILCGDASDYAVHGAYVSCVAQAANAAVRDGLISPNEKSRFIRNAAKQ